MTLRGIGTHEADRQKVINLSRAAGLFAKKKICALTKSGCSSDPQLPMKLTELFTIFSCGIILEQSGNSRRPVEAFLVPFIKSFGCFAAKSDEHFSTKPTFFRCSCEVSTTNRTNLVNSFQSVNLFSRLTTASLKQH